MKTTLDLLARALAELGVSQRALSKQLGLSPAALAVAKHNGSLSPVVAGQLAELLNQPVAHWISVATMETTPRSRVTDHLRKAVANLRI